MNKLAILLLILISSLSCKDLITCANFLLNRDFITKTFCINRDKPAMQCNGRCHLSKLIKKSKEQEKDTPNTVEEKRASLIFLLNFDQLVTCFTDNHQKRQSVFSYKTIFSSAHLKQVFHPPKLI